MALTPLGFKRAAIIVEIVALIVVAALVQWLSTVLLHTNAFWPLMLTSFVYLGIRIGLIVRNSRPTIGGRRTPRR